MAASPTSPAPEHTTPERSLPLLSGCNCGSGCSCGCQSGGSCSCGGSCG